MKINLVFYVTLSILITTVGNTVLADESNQYTASERAINIAKKSLIVDGHIDVPHRLHKGWVDVTLATKGGDFDSPRAIAGGLNAPFMSIYVPASLDGSEAVSYTHLTLLTIPLV